MFLILRSGFGTSDFEVYHKLQSGTGDAALSEAAEYLSDGGAPATGHPEDTFKVVQVVEVSKPLRARLSFLAAIQKNKERVKGILLRVLTEGETLPS